MRVPIFITIPACLIVAILVWWLGTKDKEFLTPPTPERLVEISEEWQQSSPNIPPPKPINAALLSDPAPVSPMPAEEPQPQELVLPTGDLLLAPSLAEYGTLGDNGADAMIQLATLLESKAELQRARLAWERVIDTSNPDDKQRKQAVQALHRLQKTMPPWNPDPSADISLVLHAGATLKDTQILISALEKTAELITNASDHVIKVEIKASFGKSSGIKTPRIPVAIWFSRPPNGEGSFTAETPPISFMADPKQPEALSNQVAAGVYSLLRTHLSTETSFTPLPEYPADVQPDTLLKYYVTRLMWREFVKGMKE